jgi:hypothetical protein
MKDTCGQFARLLINNKGVVRLLARRFAQERRGWAAVCWAFRD